MPNFVLDSDSIKTKLEIKVIGVGSMAIEVVNIMIESGLKDFEYIDIVDDISQKYAFAEYSYKEKVSTTTRSKYRPKFKMKAPVVLQINNKFTTPPQYQKIIFNSLRGADLIFVICSNKLDTCLIEAIAKISNSIGALTIGIIVPEIFEGYYHKSYSTSSTVNLIGFEKYLDATIFISYNKKIIFNKPYDEGLELVCEFTKNTIRSFKEIINSISFNRSLPYLLKILNQNNCRILTGTGFSKGMNMAKEASEMAFENLNLNYKSLNDSSLFYVCVTANKLRVDIELSEIEQFITEKTFPEISYEICCQHSNDVEDNLYITIFVIGIDDFFKYVSGLDEIRLER